MIRLLSLLLGAMAWLLAALGHRRAVRIGHALGSFIFHVVRVRRRIVLENLSGAFPERSERERLRIARDCYRHLGRVLVEILIASRMSSEDLNRIVRWNGVEKLHQALADGTGVIMCMAHLGNWELLGFACADQGLPVSAVTKKLSGAANELLHANRRLAFKELAPKNSFKEGLEVLARSELLALIVDQHMPGDKAAIIDFLGRPAAAMPAPALFAMRSNAPVYCTWMTLDEEGVYQFHVRGPFPVPEGEDLPTRLRAHTQLIADDLAQVVREHPEQWFWVHRRWKVKPPEPLKEIASVAGA